MSAGKPLAAPLGIIAGAGEIPILLAKNQQRQGQAVFLVGITAVSSASITRYPHAWCKPVAVGHCIRLLQQAGCRDVVMVGALSRPKFVPQMFDWTGVQLAFKILKQKRLGDDNLLRHVLAVFERKGLRLRGVHEFLPDMLAQRGYLGLRRAGARARDDIALGVTVVQKIGELDIGQAAVICRGHVLAVEGVDGTDALLRRVAGLPKAVRGTQDKRAGVLVKLPKPQQEQRVDLPTLGPATIALAAKAGLAGIACAAGKTLIVRKAQCRARADAAGLFVYGCKD